MVEAGTGLVPAKSNGGGHRIVRSDLSECSVLEEAINKLKGFGLSMDDYYAERVEHVDGTIDPARFIIKHGVEVVRELDNLRQLVEAVRQVGSAGVEVKRFKGLGEMNGEELWDTTMDPDRRSMLKVVISDEPDDPEQMALDAREADRIFSILMGDNVELRRQFIETNAAHVKNLDI